jgi:aminopeptidase N
MVLKKLFLTCVGILLLLAPEALHAQNSARRNFTRPQTYDVEHYVIRASFDRAGKKVIGDTTIRFKPLKDGFATAEFDAVGISFSSVVLEPSGKAVTFRTPPGKIVVALDKAYPSSETLTLRFKHTAIPKKGVYFADPELAEDGKEVHSAQIWTQGEADEARHWFPSFDFPSDKATTEQYITANEGETVIGNGELVEETKGEGGTVTSHFRMNVPIPTYLVSFVIGKYAKVADKYREIPLGVFVYRGSESIVPLAFGKTKDMLRFYEEVTKIDFPFNKYDQTIVAGFAFGGMENVTATTMADTEIFAARHPLFVAGVEDLVSHELAHSWFGNMVTCRNWAELWLNEGFATFMEAAFREKMYGRRNYMIKITRDAELFMLDDAVNKKRNALFNQNADNVAELFDRPATIYNKGGAVLHTLREEIGDEAFWKAVNSYLTKHRYGSVESSDLKEAMEVASGRDLDWFFDQWVYMGGHPKLSVRQVWNEQSKTLRLTVTQTQKADSLTPSVFRLPMDVEFDLGSAKESGKLNVTKRVETFSYKLPRRPSSIKVDPQEKIPVKMVKLTPSAEK